MSDTPENDKIRSNCTFCQVADKKTETEIKYEDDTYISFMDRRPAAPHHYLIIPRSHLKDASTLTSENVNIITEMVEIGNKLLDEKKGDREGVRMGFHWPPFHTVGHLHLHVIAPESQMGLISKGIFKKDSYWFVSPESAIEYIRKKSSS